MYRVRDRSSRKPWGIGKYLVDSNPEGTTGQSLDASLLNDRWAFKNSVADLRLCPDQTRLPPRCLNVHFRKENSTCYKRWPPLTRGFVKHERNKSETLVLCVLPRAVDPESDRIGRFFLPTSYVA